MQLLKRFAFIDLVVMVVTGESKQKKLPTENQLSTKCPRKSFLTSSQASLPVTAGRIKPRKRNINHNNQPGQSQSIEFIEPLELKAYKYLNLSRVSVSVVIVFLISNSYL